MLRHILISLAAFVVVAACTASGSGASGSGGASASASAEDPSGAPAPSGVGTLPASILDPIVADAATRLGVDPSDVRIVSARAETFSDGSLGCPKAGEMYTQALVDGYQVIAEVDGTQLDYRGSAPNQFKLCERP